MAAEHYLVDSRGNDLVTGENRSELLANASPADTKPNPAAGRFVMTRATADGKYNLIVVGPPPLSPWIFAPYFLLVLIVVALLCWVLAITIASPLRKMSIAVDRFGSGDLSVRLHSSREDEIGEVARAFDTMADRIQTLMTAERRLLQDVSHELRSPLARLSFAAQLVKTASDRTAAVARLQKEIDRLTALVSALLQMTRAEGDPTSQRWEPIAFSKLVHDIAGDCQLEAEARDCRILVDATPGLELDGDPELLRRAIENVVRNAVRYSASGSIIEVKLKKDNASTRVVVRDYGPGVPSHVLDKIFSPFFRVDDARTSDTGGVGLGLAIASRAVQLHRGKITAVNANPGLLIKMEFPVCGPKRANARATDGFRPQD
jgi:two-component system sensor histidine kinase CpxA